jgi:hypothetical protein
MPEHRHFHSQNARRWGCAFLVFLLCACSWGRPAVRLVDPVMLDSFHLQFTLLGGAPLVAPADSQIEVKVEDSTVGVSEVSWQAGIREADPAQGLLRTALVGTLTLVQAVPSDAQVTLLVDGLTGPTRFSEDRISPAFHTQKVAYDVSGLKEARLGLYLGTGGELPLPGPLQFRVVDLGSGQEVFLRSAVLRPEGGYPQDAAPNQQVWNLPLEGLPQGRYSLGVLGLGSSAPFSVEQGAAARTARLYATGLYNQRCGQELQRAYTTHPRPPCHTDLVTNLGRSVVGGHHDAGDYGRYIYNSAQVANLCLFALEALPSFSAADDLGLPESADGTPDLLAIAMRELAVISALQDADGTFYSRLRPRDRAYDADKAAAEADPQKASPGNTVSTASAVAALAQAARSPALRRVSPKLAKQYGQQALRGWKALQGMPFAKTDHHYGEVFEDRDEKTWALVELYLFSGDTVYQKALADLWPTEPKEVRRWGWLPCHEGYGAAARSFALSRAAFPRDPQLLDLARSEIRAAGELWVEASESSAYGSTFPNQSKRFMTAGWFFPHDASLDLIAAAEVVSEPRWEAAVWRNWNYELGVNPKDVAFLTGAAASSPKHIVNQQADHDQWEQPPVGLPVGSMISGPRGRPEYAALDVPGLSQGKGAKPLDQRWADYPNVLSEATVVNQTRGLLSCLWLAQRAQR